MSPSMLVAILLASGSAAPAQENPQPVAAAKEKKICRSVVPTGTIMARRICLTRTEWAQLNGENQKHADMMIDNRNRALDTGAMGDKF